MRAFSMKGVVPAMVASFNEDETLNESAVRQTVRFLVDQGVNGLYLTGSTGEMLLMTEQERNRLIELVVDENAGRVPVVAHVGNIGTLKSIELAKTARRIGVDGISSIAPIYWNFCEEEIYGYYRDLSEATDLPFIVYNIALAKLMNVNFVKRLAVLDNVCGIKYTATTHFEIGKMKRELGEDFRVYSGCDEMAASGLMNGADGIIGSFYNLMPEVYLRIYNACREGRMEEAAREQQIADTIILKALEYNYVGIIKLGMKWMGVDAGRCRRPFRCYDAQQEEQIKRVFRNLRDQYEIRNVNFLNAI